MSLLFLLKTNPRVSVKIGGGTLSGTSVSITTAALDAAAVGDLVIVAFAWAAGSSSLSTVTDTSGNSWTVVAMTTPAGGPGSDEGGYGYTIVTTAWSAGGNTVTGTLGTGVPGGRIWTALKVPAAALHSAPSFDQHTEGTATSATPSITTASTLAQASETAFVIDLVRSAGTSPTWAWNLGWTEIDHQTGSGTTASGLAVAEFDTASTAALTGGFTGGGATDNHALSIIAFKAPSSAVNVSPPAATAAASALVPTVSTAGGPQTVSPPAATAAASALVPTVSTSGGATGLQNTAEGGTNGTTVTTGNSGGTSGDAWTTVNGTPTFSTTQAAHGSLSYSMAATSQALIWTQTSTADGYGRAYVYLAVSTASFEVAGFLAGTAKWRVIFATTAFQIDNGTFTVEATGTAPTTGQWYRLEWHHNSASQLEVKVWNSMDSSGAPDQDLTAAAATNSNVDEVRYFPSQNIQLYVDDLNGFATAWPGPTGGTNQTVTAPAATAAASAPTPGLAAGFTPAAATASASAPVPTVTISIAAPAAVAAASSPVSTPQLRLSPPAATAAASAPTPTVTALVSASPPAATASASAPVPTLNVALPAPAASAAASAPVPTPQLRASPPPATASASGLVPGVALQPNPPAATAAAAAPVPLVFAGQTVLPPAATAAEAAPAPTPQLKVPPSAATAAATAPIPSLAAAVVVPAATAAASAPVPTIQVVIAVPVATAAASAPAPTVSAGAGSQTVSPPAATASASAPAPTLQVKLAPPAATATAASPTPTLQLRASPPAASATGSAPLPVLQLKVSPPAAGAAGSSPTPTPQLRFVVPVASASATAPIPTVLVSVSGVVQRGWATGTILNSQVTGLVGLGVDAEYAPSLFLAPSLVLMPQSGGVGGLVATAWPRVSATGLVTPQAAGGLVRI